MKKLTAIMMILCLLLCAASCKKAAPSPNIVTPATTAAPTEATNETDSSETIQIPFLAVGVPVIYESVQADNGDVVYTSSVPYMTLTLDGQATADRIINDFMNKVNSAAVSAESMKEAAKSAHASSGNWIPYSFQLQYSPMRIDTNVLSLYGTTMAYSGSSHPEYTCTSASYNMITGDALTLGSILTHEDKLLSLRDLLIQKLEAQKDDKFLREGFQNDIIHRFEGEESYDDKWYFSQAGLCFYFAPYEIAPYSSGVIIAEIPYSELAGIIADEFFPPEVSSNNATVSVVPFTTEAANNYAQTSYLILHQEGDKYFVETDNTVYNLRIVHKDEDSALNASNNILYQAFCLNPGNAVMVQIPADRSGMYYVEYENNGTVVSTPILVNE